MENTEVMTVKDWLITLLILIFVPIVNIVMLFVWGFGDGNENRKNFCRAYLIIYAITIALSIAFSSVLLGLAYSFINSGSI